MKKYLFIVLMLLPLGANSAVEIDGLYYELDSYTETAKVSRNTPGTYYYKVDIWIPSSVNYKGIDYKVVGIGAWAFDNATKLTSITIPQSVTYIEENAFYNCSSLTSIMIPEKVHTIGRNAFQLCKSLTTITIPKSVTSIGQSVFYGCISLASIIVEEGNPRYDSHNDCNAIIWDYNLIAGCKNTVIPDDVITIQDNAFAGCGLTGLDIPNSVKYIGEQAFLECINLSYITLPPGLISIGRNAFGNCRSLVSVTIPAKVTSIGMYAFSGCSLQNVTSLIEEPFVINDVFSNYQDVVLYVPKGTKSKYESINGWKNFTNIVEITKKCETPGLKYEYGKLYITCETEGAEFVTDIKDTDIKKHHDSTITLSATYNISVYATKDGYENSDVVTATLCWIDQEPKTEGITNSEANVPAKALLIQNSGGIINVQGADDGEHISIYGVNGMEVGSAISQNGMATINTSLQTGSVAIVKRGTKSIKVILK